MKKHEPNIQEVIASLKDHRTSLLIVDTKRCKHSQRLLEEVRLTTSLNPSNKPTSPQVMHILDLCEQGGKALDILTWVPGVPCLLSGSKVHLGVDAFAKSRDLCRAADGGVSLQTLSLSFTTRPPPPPLPQSR